MKTSQKKTLVEHLKRMPIIETACKQAGVSRASYYRWKLKDPKFAEQTEKAIEEGTQLINDVAESQLLSAIKDRNMTGIIFWLKNRHVAYREKVEVNANIKQISEKLTPEQEGVVREALRLASLPVSDVTNPKEDGKQN